MSFLRALPIVGVLLSAGVAQAQAQTSAVCNGLTVPAWQTVNRPTTPIDQTQGYNLTSGYCEIYQQITGAWQTGPTGWITGAVLPQAFDVQDGTSDYAFMTNPVMSNTVIGSAYNQYANVYGLALSMTLGTTTAYVQPLYVALTQSQSTTAFNVASASFFYKTANVTNGSGEAASFGVSNNSTSPTDWNAAMLVYSYGTTPAQEGIQFQNYYGTPGGEFINAIQFQLAANVYSLGGSDATYSYISDDQTEGGTSGTNTPNLGQTPYGIFWTGSTYFGTAEYSGPSFMIGPTVASYNARIEILGTASAAPSIAAVGSGASPATNANINLAPLGTGVVSISGTLGVSCPANTVTLATFTVTKGIVTHC